MATKDDLQTQVANADTLISGKVLELQGLDPQIENHRQALRDLIDQRDGLMKDQRNLEAQKRVAVNQLGEIALNESIDLGAAEPAVKVNG